jgi:hypothetical protein
MARIRRVVIATRRVSIRHTETRTKRAARKALEESADSLIARAFAEQGIILSPEDIKARGFRLSTPREWRDGHDVIGYTYDITARV